MTDIVALSKRLFDRIEWQRVPDTVTREDLSRYICNAIRDLYIMTGRAEQFREDWFTVQGDLYVAFSESLPIDEQEYILVSAEIAFYSKAQSGVTDLVSYTTDALSVTHADKPYANIQRKIDDLRSKQRQLWYKMTRYHLL